MCGEKSTGRGKPFGRIGSPPHVRGKELLSFLQVQFGRITPACAGKRTRAKLLKMAKRDHPRMCGEKLDGTGSSKRLLGSPPHVRGKVTVFFVLGEPIRITPACAGKSLCGRRCTPPCRDHPRMCGEKNVDIRYAYQIPGSPPHVRGKVFLAMATSAHPGITPACAGKRTRAVVKGAGAKDHPRMCGEKVSAKLHPALSRGSPPHVRGKVFCGVSGSICHGITPACAGKSRRLGVDISNARDHPRMCGEKGLSDRYVSRVIGSPPHVRGKGIYTPSAAKRPWITPACAGKSKGIRCFSDRSWDHPRMCGEKSVRLFLYRSA